MNARWQDGLIVARLLLGTPSHPTTSWRPLADAGLNPTANHPTSALHVQKGETHSVDRTV